MKITTYGSTVVLQKEDDGSYTVIVYMENQCVKFTDLSEEGAALVYYRMGGNG